MAKERPIILKAHEVRGILDGRQTQMRRIVTSKWLNIVEEVLRVNGQWVWDTIDYELTTPFGKVGDRLWVREAFGLISYDQGDDCKTDIVYREAPWFLESDGKTRADEKIGNWDLDGGRWRPAQHMQRHESRILMEIVSVRVERLQDISEDDAKAEGCQDYLEKFGIPRTGSITWYARYAFIILWKSIYGENSWLDNPWVWVLEFKRVDTI